MRIAQIAPLSNRIPPKGHGGAEQMVSILTEGLVKKGHDVTLFATSDAITKAKLEIVQPYPLEEVRIYDPVPSTILSLTKAFNKRDDFDIIHINTEPAYVGLPFAKFNQTPTVVTIHTAYSFVPQGFLNEFKDVNIVAVSENHRKGKHGLNFAGTIYNGIPVEKFPYKRKRGDYLLFIGRITLEKGPHFAIEAARKLNMPLIIAGNIPPIPSALEYFNSFISPGLDNEQIKFVGEVGPEERNKLMVGAKCLLNPITWREPFGFVMVEAMATGCPVIAFRRGSAPELIKDKKTGFIVDSARGMARAVKQIGSIDPRACRDRVKQNFCAERMVESYEKVYEKIISKKI